MYGASLRRLAPNLYAARAGLEHCRYGDPWTYSANVRMRGPVAFIFLGNGGKNSHAENVGCQLAVLRRLKRDHGIRRAWWDHDGIGKVNL